MKRLITFAKGICLIVILVMLMVAIVGRDRLLAALFGPINTAPIQFSSLVLTENPNQFLVCRIEYCAATPHLVSPIFQVPPDTLRQRWMDVLTKQPRMGRQTIAGPDGQITHIQRSTLMRYPDSITVQFFNHGENASTLAIYSRSHYGKSDFGVNEARIVAWLEQLKSLF